MEEFDESIDITIDQKKLRNVSFSAGGIKGIAFIGCVKALQEKDLLSDIQSFAGSSVGSLISTLIVCGADYNYLKDASLGACKFFSNFKIDIFSLFKLNLLQSEYGIYKNEELRNYLRSCIQDVLKIDYDLTFKDLYAINPVDLIITASCLETQTPFYFSHHTTGDTPVSEALTISCSVPLLFSRSIFQNKTLVDGCIVEKLPMQCWPQEEIENTMAFLIQSNGTTNTQNFSNYLNAIESTISSTINSNYLSKYKNSITMINPGNIVACGVMPNTYDMNKVIFASYFQTLSELERRGFIDEDVVPKSQEVSQIIFNDEISEQLEKK